MGLAHLLFGNVCKSTKAPTLQSIVVAADPTVGSLVYYSKFDAKNKYLIIDAQSEGITVAQLKSLITISSRNSVRSEISFDTSDEELVVTGSQMQVDVYGLGTSKTSYKVTIVVLGDINSDGKVTCPDVAHEHDSELFDECFNLDACLCGGYLYYNVELTPEQLIACDTNFSDSIDITDSTRMRLKVTDLETYLTFYSSDDCEHEALTLGDCQTLPVCSLCGESFGELVEHQWHIFDGSYEDRQKIQWDSSPGESCKSAWIQTYCDVCGTPGEGEFGVLTCQDHEPTNCGDGIEDCYVTFTNSLFTSLNGSTCPAYHEYNDHTGYTYTGSTKGSTCQVRGKDTYTCKCGKDSYTVTNALYGDHDFAELVNQTAGKDCSTTGVSTYRCTNTGCSETVDRSNDLTGPHDYTYKKPNMVTHYEYCNICGATTSTVSCVMEPDSIDYVPQSTRPGYHWINGKCICGNNLQDKGVCMYNDDVPCQCGWAPW